MASKFKKGAGDSYTLQDGDSERKMSGETYRKTSHDGDPSGDPYVPSVAPMTEPPRRKPMSFSAGDSSSRTRTTAANGRVTRPRVRQILMAMLRS